MGYPNTFSADKWKMAFSNIPSLDDKKIDMKLFDEYVKSLILPDFSVEILNSEYLTETEFHPISRTNSNLNQVSIEFTASEGLENYYYFYNWFQMLRYHQTNEGKLKDTVIKAIDVELLDNQKRTISRLRFTEAILTSLGSLPLIMGDSDDVNFPVLFQYQECKLVR